MSAALVLLPDALPLFAEGAGRHIGHPVELGKFPGEYRHVVRETWDALVARDIRNVTLLPSHFTDLVLSQLTGLAPRTVQESLYFLELGPSACHVLAGIERRLRAATRAGDAGDSARLRAELVAFRQARQDLKDRFKAAAGRMAAIASKGELTDDDRGRLAALAAERAAIRAELVAPDALIFRHSGPGFHGDRFIEIVRRLAKKKADGKGGAAGKVGAAAKPDRKASMIPNVGTVSGASPEQIAAAQARIAAHEAGDRFIELSAEEQAEADRTNEEIRRRREAAGRKKPRPRLELDEAPRGPAAPGSTAQDLLEARRRAMGIRIVPESEGSDPGVPPQPSGP